MKKAIILFVIFSVFIISNAFCQPFGIEFGMSLEQVRKISKTPPENIEDDWYIITPPNTHELFEEYLVQIHRTYGVYFIKAIGKDIRVNRHGTELISRFNSLVSSVERTYGNYLLIDEIIPESLYKESQWFMTALERGDRTLVTIWDKDEGSKLPDDISLIIIAAQATNSFTGYIILEYYSINYSNVKAERDSVF